MESTIKDQQTLIGLVFFRQAPQRLPERRRPQTDRERERRGFRQSRRLKPLQRAHPSTLFISIDASSKTFSSGSRDRTIHSRKELIQYSLNRRSLSLSECRVAFFP